MAVKGNYKLLAFSGMIIISGCFNKNNSCKLDSNDVLIMSGDKVVLSEPEFSQYIEDACYIDPQFKKNLETSKDAFKNNVLMERKRAAVISEWAEKEGIKNSKEYQVKRDFAIKSIEEKLVKDEFFKRNNINVTDQEIKDFYESQKLTNSTFKISQQGIKSIGIEFDNREKAEKFLEQVKNRPASIIKQAEVNKFKVVDLGVLNSSSNVLQSVKDKVLNGKVPSVYLIRVDSKYWVVGALSKEVDKYHSLESLKDGIKNLLLMQKIEQAIAKFEKHLDIKLNNKYKPNIASSIDSSKN